MSLQVEDPRELVRQVIKEKDFEGVIGQTIEQEGQEIVVSKNGDGTARFDLPGLRKSYVLKSGRIYERDFISQGPSTDEEGEGSSPMATQLDYRGEPEEVDSRLYKNRLECECGNVRWVKNADFFQVKKCKPCTIRERRKRRRDRRRAN